ncbi:hypothetical protein LJC11_02155 [Bacteroidales bacterium OttesenSCG-928-I21]|nr:hypothetical protein [Bacteroidales bacterium OttesenSCG-928-I21]
MKRIIFILLTLFLCVSFNVNAQEAANANLSQNRDLGGFVSLDLSFSSVDKKFGFFTGGSGGFIVKNIRLGIFFNGLTSNTKIKNKETNNSYKASCSFGGIMAGYPLWHSKRFHGVAELRLFVGKMATINANDYELDNNSIFYGLTPSLGIEYYLTDILALGLNIDYRHCFFPDTPTLYSKTSLNSLGASISIKLGHFR